MGHGKLKWLVLGCTVAAGCHSDARTGSALPDGVSELRSELARETDPDIDDKALTQLGKSNRAFAASLYHELRARPGNLFFSPHSLSSALAMSYAGAKTETAAEMEQALHFELPRAQLHAAFNRLDLTLRERVDVADEAGIPFDLSVVNAVWAQQEYSFQESYLDILALSYGAGIYLLDFAKNPNGSRLKINDWVASQTHDQIQELLPEASIGERTRLVLTNAAYFRAAWLEPFATHNTKNQTFHARDGDVDVPMMHGVMPGAYVRGDGYEAALLPYSAAGLGMVLIVPNADTFDAFDEGFDANKLEEALTGLAGDYDLDVTLPRFQINSEVSTVPALATLGMRDAFAPGAADFSGMSENRELYINSVEHQAYVKVDEQGTEATAATAVVAALPISAPQVISLRVDRPFLFAIYDASTSSLLFLGRMVNP